MELRSPDGFTGVSEHIGKDTASKDAAATEVAASTPSQESDSVYDDQEILPPELSPGDYGSQHERVRVSLGQLIMLEQMREGVSRETSRIQDSIERNDLYYEPHIARMDRAEIEEYVDFVNNVWGASHDIDELPCDEDGYYYLVEDGHSRVIAMTRLEVEKARRAREEYGCITDPLSATIMCNVRNKPTPWEIISKQAETNIHRQVPREREAMGVVEAFYYGRRKGMWDSQEEFLRQYGDRYSKDTVNAALRFLELPSIAREEVFGGRLRYNTAIELAKTYRLYIPYKLASFGWNWGELSDTARNELRKSAVEWVQKEIADIQSRSKKFTTGSARTRYVKTRENWCAAIDGEPVTAGSVKSSRDGENGVTGQLAMAVDEDPERQIRVMRKEQLKEYREKVDELINNQTDQVRRACTLHQRLALGEDGSEELLDKEIRKIHDLRVEWKERRSNQQPLFSN